MNLNDLLTRFESVLPLALQESWDHCGLNLGSRSQNVTGVLFSYDVCLETIAAAKKHKCQLIVSHHPFRMKVGVNIDCDDYEGRIIAACIKNKIALYAAHTNHDRSVYSLNRRYLERLGLENLKPLDSKSGTLFKLAVFVPQTHTEILLNALFAAGAGGIGNYSECSFRVAGTGTFKGNEQSSPKMGRRNVREAIAEDRIEVLVTQESLTHVTRAMKSAHPYEEVAYDLFRLESKRDDIGMGMFGDWRQPMPKKECLAALKKIFRAPHIRFVDSGAKTFRRAAICTGSGASLIPTALAKGCDLFITGDVKYHQAIDAKRHDLAIADVGHFYSEIDSVKILKNLFEECFGTGLRLHEYKDLKDAFDFV